MDTYGNTEDVKSELNVMIVEAHIPHWLRCALAELVGKIEDKENTH